MNTDDEQQELEWIERYLSDKLATDERETLELKMRNNPDFSRKVDQLRQITHLIQVGHVEQVAQKTLRQLYQRQPIWIQRYSYPVLGSAVAVAAMLIFLVYLGISPIQLPVINDDLLVVKGAPEQVDPTTTYGRILAGQQAIKEGNYLSAIRLLEPIPERTELRGYFREASRWYLVLAYLHTDQPNNARHQIEELDKVDRPEFQVSRLDRWKAYVQLLRRSW